MVTEAAVWDALAEIPDPEIPTISLVDLGVVRDVSVEEERVHVAFTPTFLGCPALEVMKGAMEEAIRAVGGEPDVEVVHDDSWSTDRITPAGREKLRALRLRASLAARGGPADARPADEGGAPLPVLRLDGDAPREPLRPDPVPFAPLLRELPAAVRAVQDDLGRCFQRTSFSAPCSSGCSKRRKSAFALELALPGAAVLTLSQARSQGRGGAPAGY